MGIDKKKIDRINELYRKSKAEGLTECGAFRTGAAAPGVRGGVQTEPAGPVEQY